MDKKELLKNYKEKELASEIKIQEKNMESYLDENKVHFIRCDGRHFKTFTKGFKKPFDDIFRNTMTKTMIALCEEIGGNAIGFTQSDEITVMFKKEKPESELIFSGRVQKISSSMAASCTLYFNKFLIEEINLAKNKLIDEYQQDCILSISEINDNVEKEFEIYNSKILKATFDCRLFSMAPEDAKKVFIWRILDCQKNAIQMISRCYFSNKELHSKNTLDMKNMLLSKNIDIDNIANKYIYGVVAIKEEKVLYVGTDKECIRNKYVTKDSLDIIFNEMYDYLYVPNNK